MNKTFKIAAMSFGAAVLMATSCAKNLEFGNDKDGDLVECTISAEFNITKVSLNNDGVTPNWESGDKILVLDSNKKPLGGDGLFTLTSGAGTTNGTFSGPKYIGQKPAYAIYPAAAATVSVSFPVTRGKLLGATDDKTGTLKAAVMLGSSSDGSSMTFSNACAVLKFNTGNYGKSGGADPAIASVKVSASYGSSAAPIAGSFDIDWTNLSIVASSSGTESTISIELPSSLQTNGKDVYIPILPLPKNESDVAPSMEYVFSTIIDRVAKVEHNFSDAITGGIIKDLGTAGGLNFSPNYVVVRAKYDGVTESDLKWATQNLAISTSGQKAWKGNTTSAVKVPGGSVAVVVGDYFQWAAYENYRTPHDIGGGVTDKGLLFYSSFTCTKCGDASNSYSGDSGYNSPYYVSEDSYSKYNSSDGKTVLDLFDDAANVYLGHGWRIPTYAEFEALREATYCAIDTDDAGYYVYAPNPATDAGKVNDGSGVYNKSDAILFFPLGGDIWTTSRTPSYSGCGTSGYYWTSSWSKEDMPDRRGFYQTSIANHTMYRWVGCSIRPVSE